MFVDIVLSGLVFFGGFIAIAVVVKLRERNRALKWPGVPGQVISGTASAQDVTTHAGIDDERDQVETRNFARIAYRYSVNGKRYTGKRVSIGDDMGNGDIAGLLKKYPRGKVVEVFYDPADPARAVLERDLSHLIAADAACVRRGIDARR